MTAILDFGVTNKTQNFIDTQTCCTLCVHKEHLQQVHVYNVKIHIIIHVSEKKQFKISLNQKAFYWP